MTSNNFRYILSIRVSASPIANWEFIITDTTDGCVLFKFVDINEALAKMLELNNYVPITICGAGSI